MARGWSGVPADTATGAHYMVLKIGNTTPAAAESWCASNAACAGFYYASSVASNEDTTKVRFKDSTQAFFMDGAHHEKWTSRIKIARAPPFVVGPNKRDPPPHDTCAGQQVWAKRLSDGKLAVLLVNVGEVTLDSFDLPLSALKPAFGKNKIYAVAPTFAVRDVWNHEDLPDAQANESLHFEAVEGHDSRFLILTAKSMAVPTPTFLA